MTFTAPVKLDDCRRHGAGSGAELFLVEGDSAAGSVKLVRGQDSTALGAGIHAAAAAGFYSDIRAAADAMTGIETVFEPDAAAHARYSEIFAAYLGIYPGLKRTFQRIAETMP